MTQGEPGDTFYVIESGTVDHPRRPSSRDARAGEGIGEIALLSDRPRTATVRDRAADRLPAAAEAFLEAVTGSPNSVVVADDSSTAGSQIARELSRPPAA